MTTCRPCWTRSRRTRVWSDGGNRSRACGLKMMSRASYQAALFRYQAALFRSGGLNDGWSLINTKECFFLSVFCFLDQSSVEETLLSSHSMILTPATPAAHVTRAGVTSGLPSSPVPSPHLVILAAQHGDEPAGVAGAADTTLPSLPPDSPWACATFVISNPPALALGKRFIDANLNRCFTREVLEAGASDAEAPFEHRRARELAPLLATATAVLDLHTTSAENTPAFAMFSPASPSSAALATALPVHYALSDATGAGLGLAIEYAASHGAAAVTVECGQHAEAASVGVAAACIRAALAWRPGGDRHSATITTLPPPPHPAARAAGRGRGARVSVGGARARRVCTNRSRHSACDRRHWRSGVRRAWSGRTPHLCAGARGGRVVVGGGGVNEEERRGFVFSLFSVRRRLLWLVFFMSPRLHRTDTHSHPPLSSHESAHRRAPPV